MKRVLVISDNEELVAAFIKISGATNIASQASFQYRYSSVNRTPAQMIKLGFSSIDLKDTNTVDAICRQFDIVFSIHCKQIFPVRLVNSLLCINLHPGFNPSNKGWYPQAFSILNKQIAGATLHVMTDDIDAGPIISQIEVDIDAADTSLTLYRKIQVAEISLIKEKLASILSDSYTVTACPFPGNFNRRADFDRLCSLDLTSVGTLQEHIDLLRAVSHPPFHNAYYDDNLGNKIYIRVELLKKEVSPAYE